MLARCRTHAFCVTNARAAPFWDLTPTAHNKAVSSSWLLMACWRHVSVLQDQNARCAVPFMSGLQDFQLACPARGINQPCDCNSWQTPAGHAGLCSVMPALISSTTRLMYASTLGAIDLTGHYPMVCMHASNGLDRLRQSERRCSAPWTSKRGPCSAGRHPAQSRTRQGRSSTIRSRPLLFPAIPSARHVLLIGVAPYWDNKLLTAFLRC